MNSLIRTFFSDGHITRLFIIMFIIFIIMAGIDPSVFLSFDSFSSMAFQFPEFGLFALAMMVTMISGGIDLSIVGIANLSSIVSALIMVKTISDSSSLGYSLLMISVAILASLLVGAVCGLFNGAAIAFVGIPPILVTLGTMQLFMGLAIVITKGNAVVGLPKIFSDIGNGYIWVVPVPLIIFVISLFIIYFLLNKRSFGIKLFMLGANPTAAKYSGLKNTVILLKTYVISGILSAIAGLVIVAHTNSAKADYGTSYVLQALLVSVMGGVDYKGGSGKISGVVMAVLTLQFLSSGLNLLHVGNFFKDFMWGVVLLMFMVINELSRRRDVN